MQISAGFKKFCREQCEGKKFLPQMSQMDTDKFHLVVPMRVATRYQSHRDKTLVATHTLRRGSPFRDETPHWGSLMMYRSS